MQFPSYDDVRRLHRVFREDEHQICKFINEQKLVPNDDALLNLADVQYLEILESDVEEQVEGMLQKLVPGQLKGLSIDLPDNDDEDLLDKTIQHIATHSDHLRGLQSLYLYVPAKLNLNGLLESLPDLEHLYVYGDDLDVSFLRHASLKHLISDDAEPVEGLELCSFPSLHYLEVDQVNDYFFEQLNKWQLGKLEHLGVLGINEEVDPDELMAHARMPATIRSLRLDGFPTTLDGDVIIKNPVCKQLSHVSFYDTRIAPSGVLVHENFPRLQHLGMVQEPENGGSEAEAALEILQGKALPEGIISLDLQGLRFDDAQLGQLIELPLMQRLRYLNLNFHTAKDEELLARFQSLPGEVYLAPATTGLDDDDEDDDYE